MQYVLRSKLIYVFYLNLNMTNCMFNDGSFEMAQKVHKIKLCQCGDVPLHTNQFANLRFASTSCIKVQKECPMPVCLSNELSHKANFFLSLLSLNVEQYTLVYFVSLLNVYEEFTFKAGMCF